MYFNIHVFTAPQTSEYMQKPLPHYKHVLMTLFPTFSKMERKESKINFWCTSPRRTKEFCKLMKVCLH